MEILSVTETAFERQHVDPIKTNVCKNFSEMEM